MDQIIKIMMYFNTVQRGQYVYIEITGNKIDCFKTSWPIASYFFNLNTQVYARLDYYNKYHKDQMELMRKIEQICKEREYKYEWVDEKLLDHFQAMGEAY